MFHNAFGNALIDMVFLLVSFMRIYASIIKVILVIINFLMIFVLALNEICIGKRIKCIDGMVVGGKD